MKAKSIGANYIYNLIYQVLVLIVPFILTPYVSRVLSPEGIGEFSYATTITGYFVLAGNLGVATYGQLEIAKTRTSEEKCARTFSEIFLTRFITMSLSLLVYILYVFFANSPYETMFRVLVIQILASLFDISWLMQGLEEFKKIVIRNIIIKLAGVLLVLLFVKQETDLYKYALIMNGIVLLGNLSLWGYVPRLWKKVEFSGLNLSKHLKKSVVYFVPSVATTLYLTLDKTMIEWFSITTAENGYYEQAQKIEQMAVTAVTSLSVVTMPRMALLYKENKFDELRIIFNKTLRFALLLSMPMCIGLIFVADIFIPIYLGEGYETSATLLKIFSLLLVVVGLNNAFGKQILMPFGKQKEYNLGVIAGAVINFCLNMLLIPRFLSIGAAIASVIAESSILMVFMFYSKNFYKGINILGLSRNYAIAAAVMAVMIRAVSLIWNVGIKALVIQITIGILTYFVCLLLFKDELVIEGIYLLKNKLKVSKR